MELPFNAEAEKQVLANMIFSSDMLVETFSRLSEDDFYLKEHKIIYTTLKTIFSYFCLHFTRNKIFSILV